MPCLLPILESTSSCAFWQSAALDACFALLCHEGRIFASCALFERAQIDEILGAIGRVGDRALRKPPSLWIVVMSFVVLCKDYLRWL